MYQFILLCEKYVPEGLIWLMDSKTFSGLTWNKKRQLVNANRFLKLGNAFCKRANKLQTEVKALL